MRPATTPGRSVDVYVCTYDEPVEVVAATLAGCRALTYPHTTYLLDDGRRPEMEELAGVAREHWQKAREGSPLGMPSMPARPAASRWAGQLRGPG